MITEKELRQYLKDKTKEQVIELYLQARWEVKMLERQLEITITDEHFEKIVKNIRKGEQNNEQGTNTK